VRGRRAAGRRGEGRRCRKPWEDEEPVGSFECVSRCRCIHELRRNFATRGWCEGAVEMVKKGKRRRWRGKGVSEGTVR
jgi:hypothetical protein